LREIPVVRETERTYFVRRNGSSIDYRRISKDGDDYGFNAYAYSSKEKARDNFIRRTRKRVSWYKFWLEEYEKGLKLIEDESVS
jgi:hypothetical protein